MSFYEDYVADGLCCQSCGEYLGDGEPGYARFCAACDPNRLPPRLAFEAAPRPKRKGKRHAQPM